MRTQNHLPNERPLRLALFANGTFSTLSALMCFLLPTALASRLGIAASQLLGLGVELLGFAALTFFLGSRPTLSKTWIRRTVLGVAIADVLWVVGSVAVLLSPSAPLDSGGRWIVGIVALFVADFAAFQLYGLRKLRGDETARRSTVRAVQASTHALG